MILKIEHVGIAVNGHDPSVAVFEKILGTKVRKNEAVDSEKVRTWFFGVGDSQVELLESTDPDGVISKYLAKKGEGMHHIAFLTDNLEAEIQRLKSEGFDFVSETPKDGADNKRIVFLHPRSTCGVLVELCEEKRN
jgi:methylmalonyl-CoA/ethylmalonyl-CoA epimerase